MTSTSAECGPDAGAGFTLVELLVATTLLGLLMTIMYGGLRFGAHAWERAEAHSSGIDDIRLAQNFLRRELAAAYPLFVSSDPTKGYLDFEGTEEGVTFLAPAPAVMELGGRARIKIRKVEQKAEAFALAVSEQHELSLAGSPAFEEILLTGLKTLDFSYFGSLRRNEAPSWRSSWTGQPRLPVLIRVRATFNDRGKAWPDLIVSPEITADVSCIYDVLTNGCRGR